MTTRELITKLDEIIAANLDAADFEIATEGCDCWGDVGSLRVGNDGDGPFILLERS